MDLVLTNPLGLLAILGVPAVIAIHLLQRRSREALITTRFLLDPLFRESVPGRKVDRFRSSVPFWLQILLVILLAWLLIAPRWTHSASVQRTAVVLDASASMRAFRDELPARLGPRLRELAARASRAEFIVLDTALARESLYHGPDPGALITALASWNPLEGEHDPAPALQVAHSLVGRTGTVILVSDRARQDLPFGARLLAVGRPLPNCGFTGLSVRRDDGEDRWSVILRNHGAAPATRTWALETAGATAAPRAVTIEAGGAIVLEGAFPPGADACTLRLDPDAFTLDDAVPILREVPKPIRFAASADPAYQSLYRDLLLPLEGVLPAGEGEPADLVMATYDPLNPSTPEANAVIAVAQRHLEPRAIQGALAPSNHSLIADLNWEGLLCRSTMAIPAREGDEILLWQGERPLVFLRKTCGRSHLIFNFDLSASNARRLPATVVLVHRFVESLRAAKVAPESRNFETSQLLSIACDHHPGAPALVLEHRPALPGPAASAPRREINPDGAASLRSPAEPGFFRMSQGGALLLEGAAHFADPREGDFREAASHDDLDGLSAALIERHTREDPAWRAWVALAGAVLLVNWHFTGRQSRATA